MQIEKVKYTYFSWAPHCSRSDNINREFNGKSFMVYYDFFGSNYLSVSFKYFFQALKTFRILLKEKPNVIFVMNPPIFSCIPIWLYCKMKREAGYITDSHAAAFLLERWKALFSVQKYFFTRAITNIVTNKHHAKLIERWGADFSVVGDIPVVYNKQETYKNMKEGFNLTLVNSFSFTEPVEIVLDAARELPEINFYITGDLKNADKTMVLNRPKNVHFTDFLPDENYAWLIKNSHIVMTQCILDNTMQRGAYEAMSFETPIITSDWAILRETFYKGAVFVEADVDSVIHGIMEIKSNYDFYKKQIIELKKERLEIWAAKKCLLLDKIERFFNS